MKKLSLLALLVLFTIPIFAKHVDVEVARTVARTFWEQNLGKTTRATFSDVSSQTEFTKFYIFNTGSGFVIVSADDIATPVLGYSDSGDFDPQNIPVNMREWLIGYEYDISLGISNSVTPSAGIANDWEKLSNGQMVSQKRSRSVNALVSTKWNQGFPYNNLCPYDSGAGERTVTGCVATAMAQIMKYWNYPMQGNGSQTYDAEGYGEQSVNFADAIYDWGNMIDSYSNSATQTQKDAVATLMYHCGVAVTMSYGISSTGGSGAVTVGPANGTAEYALENFFLYKNTLTGRYRSDYEETEWKNMMTADLDAGRPIIYTGRGDEGGHCFICDGYNNNNQFHFNWGWGGYCDGYYTITSLEPGTGGIGSGNGTYNERQSAIFGIEPNAGLFAIPSALSFSGLGGSNTFMVRSSTASSQSWTASSNQSWLTITPSTGAGSGANTTVTATATRNNTANERTAAITITQGTETTTVTVVQPSGIANDPGCYGYEGNSTMFKALDEGNMVIVCGEGFGYYSTGHQVTKVKFSTYDGALTTNYLDYTNNSFTIKIYEGGSTESMGGGYTSNITRALGTQVYSQNFTQSYYGDQEVMLNTPYTIDENTNFWIAIVANGPSLILCNKVAYGSPISTSNYAGSSDAFNGKYLYSDTENGTDYLNLSTSSSYVDDEHTEIQLYSLDFLLSFCTVDPSLLTVTPEFLDFGSEGGNLDFTVKANDNVSVGWTASSSAAWLTLSATSGNGSGAIANITATATENVSGSDRTATITVTQGSETKVITVTQPDGSFADPNVWYGNTNTGVYTRFTSGYQVIIRPENYGNFEAGNKILKVKFSTYNGLQTSYTDYVNTNFTIKIYENTSMNSALINNGSTTDINACLGTLAYSQEYVAESFTSSDYSIDHVVELETPYTVREGVNFWIAVEANGNTLFLSNRVITEDNIAISGYNAGMAISNASKNYLYTLSSNGVDYLKLNYSDGYADEEHTLVRTYSYEYALSYYVSDGVTPYVESSDMNAWLLDDGVSPHNDAESTMSIGATDNIVIYPVAHNNGPETTSETISTAIKVGSETIDEVSFNTVLGEGYFAWIYGSDHSYTISAETLNQMLISGTFDVCLHVNYSGFDPDLSNNVSCITVTRETPNFTISASATPAAGGTVAGAGTYDLGEGVNLVATPAVGYRFTNWTEEGTIVSTNANYQFTVSSDRTLVANFTQINYNITATVEPANSGTISGNQSPYTYGNNVSLTANANAGYSFVNWTDEDANVVSTDATYQFAVDGNRSFVAHFEIEEYEITTVANPSEGGSVAGAGTFEYGQQVALVATVNEGYKFVNWTDGYGSVISYDANYSFEAASNVTCQANFTKTTVTPLPWTENFDGYNCTSGTWTYLHGEWATPARWLKTPNVIYYSWGAYSGPICLELRASDSENMVVLPQFDEPLNKLKISFQIGRGTSSEGYEVQLGYVSDPSDASTFTALTTIPTPTSALSNHTQYTYDLTTDNNSPSSSVYRLAIKYATSGVEDSWYLDDFDVRVPSYTISVLDNPEEGGNVTGAGEYIHGETCTLTATPAEGYSFANWTENGTVVSTDAEYSFTATADRNLIANFAINIYVISAMANPIEAGSVSGVGQYAHGDIVTLEAMATTGYTFTNFTENDSVVSTTATYSFTATANRSLIANYDPIIYTISASANPAEGGSVSGAGDYPFGQTVTLNATASTGYSFVSWTDGNTIVSTDANYSFTVSGDATLVANFQINTYTVTAVANPAEGGVVAIDVAPQDGVYDYGTNLVITATANEGYHFVQWNDGVTETQRSHIVTANAEFIAYFVSDAAEQFVITATANPTEGGSVEGSGVYEENAQAVLIATANEGFSFVNWTENGDVVSTDAEYTFSVVANRTLVANFEAITYTISATANPEEGGSITGDGEYTHGQTVTLSAVANTNYNFVNWTEDGEVVSTDAEYSFTATADRTLVANFELESSYIEESVAAISVYPNPNNGMFTLSMESIEGDVVCQIVNANGSVIETREINASDNTEIAFDCNLANGVYFVRIISGSKAWTERVVIER